jgi:hypothetical protein
LIVAGFAGSGKVNFAHDELEAIRPDRMDRAEAVAAIRKGMKEFELGEGITLDEAERRLRKKHGFRVDSGCTSSK